MNASIDNTWTQKVAHGELWDTLVIRVTLFRAEEGREVAWNGFVSSARFPGYALELSRSKLSSDAKVHVNVTFRDGLSVTGTLYVPDPGRTAPISVLGWHVPSLGFSRVVAFC